MATWFVVDKATGLVTGWQRGGASAPAGTAETDYPATSDANVEEFERLKRQASRDQRDADITLVSGVPKLAADERAIFEIIADKTEVLLGDTVTLTCTAFLANGTGVRVGLTSSIIRDWGDKRLKFDFVSGVAVRTLQIKEPKRLTFFSGRVYRLKTDLKIDVYE